MRGDIELMGGSRQSPTRENIGRKEKPMYIMQICVAYRNYNLLLTLLGKVFVLYSRLGQAKTDKLKTHYLYNQWWPDVINFINLISYDFGTV